MAAFVERTKIIDCTFIFGQVQQEPQNIKNWLRFLGILESK